MLPVLFPHAAPERDALERQQAVPEVDAAFFPNPAPFATPIPQVFPDNGEGSPADPLATVQREQRGDDHVRIHVELVNGTQQRDAEPAAGTADEPPQFQPDLATRETTNRLHAQLETANIRPTSAVFRQHNRKHLRILF